MPDYSTNYPLPKTKKRRVAIVCDWLTNMGGAERVVLQIHRAFPDAPIYTSTYEPDKMLLFKDCDVHTAWFQKLPKFLRKHQLLTIPRQWYFGRLKLQGYDVVISLSGAEAKAVRAPDGVHINICNTPTLYYWVKPENYLQKGSGGLNPLWRLGLKLLMPYAKRWDLNASQRADVMLAISTAVQQRIKNIYHRDSELLFPPADIERFTCDNIKERQGFVVFGRQVKHKRLDLAIQACNEAEKTLTVIGDGPEHERLVSLAGPTIVFKTNVSDQDIIKFVAASEAFIFPNEEDFGIVAVEAQAAGLPVIAFRAGGALDTVIDGVTGTFFDEQTPECLAEVLRKFNYKTFNREKIIQNAQKFSNESFQRSLRIVVKKAIAAR